MRDENAFMHLPAMMKCSKSFSCIWLKSKFSVGQIEYDSDVSWHGVSSKSTKDSVSCAYDVVNKKFVHR